MNVELGLLYKSPRSEFRNDDAFPLVESTKDYIDAIVQAIVVNKQKLTEKDFRTHFFNNLFTELANVKDLSLWNEFQQASQNSACFHWKIFCQTSTLKREEFSGGLVKPFRETNKQTGN